LSIYSDVNVSRSKNFIVDEASVRQSISAILSTGKGSRFFLPEFGWDVESALFNIIDTKTSRLLKHELVEAINRWDDRVVVDWGGSKVTPDYDNNRYDLILSFEIKGLTGKKFEFSGALSGATV